MTREQLISTIKGKKSFLCIGLDPDPDKIPGHLKNNEDWIFAFNKAIIDATKDVCVAYKPNLAFYEAEGSKGWDALKRTFEYIGDGHLKIADAKRGDVGNSSSFYAKAFFDKLNADAVTLSPYMGRDSIKPFLGYKGKWSIVLTLTSNPGAEDFQLELLNSLLTIGSEGIQNRQRWMQLFEHVAYEVKDWGTKDNTMFVVGATHGGKFEKIRKVVPGHFLLVPGIGSQGGDLDMVVEHGMNDEVGLLVNVSRSIIYASTGEDFATKAREAAIGYKSLMENALKRKKLV